MPPRDVIRIRGARQHNLKAVDVDIPLGALTVITGVSGSGKSSLAFDTLYAEGQRRYVETFSAYARQFLERMDRPQVDAVEGIPPAVAIERSRPVRGSRSTVGTMSELLDHLKLLWAKVGRLVCPGCDRPVVREGPEHAADHLAGLRAGQRLWLGFTLAMGDGRRPSDAAEDLRTAGFGRVVTEAGVIEDVLPEGANLPASGSLFVLVDRVVVGRTSRGRLVDSLETAFRAGSGRVEARAAEPEDGAPSAWRFSEGLHCAFCDRDFREPTPNLFSFNSPLGACATCHGFGRISGIDWDLVVPDPSRTLAAGAIKPFQTPSKRRHQRALLAWCREEGVPTDVPWKDLDASARRAVLHGEGGWAGVEGFFRKLARKSYKVHVRVLLARYRGYPPCPACQGARLADEGRAWRVDGQTLPEVLALDVRAARAFFDAFRPDTREEVVELLRKEIQSRLECLDAVGLGYLSLDRQARTLSGGEVQRVNLTAAIGTNLVGTLFVLDEPSVGLHPRDTERLVAMLRRLRDQGNTVVVVEHDPGILAAADHVVDLGPGAGEAGGQVVASGTPAALERAPQSLTGAYLAGRRRVDPGPRRAPARGEAPAVGVRGARAHNLQGVDLACRLGELTVLSGVSGSGKSSLAHDVLYLAVARELGRPEGTPGPHDAVVGVDAIRDVVLVDQGAVGRSRRANVATYVGAWTGIRTLFGTTPAAVAAGFTPSTFSFNVAGGRCERCEGEGVERVEMQFLSDVEVTCPDCEGTRFRPEVRAVRWDGLAIADVLGLTVEDACVRFADRRPLRRALEPLREVGLGYLRLGQSLATLSSGEAQRLRLAAALREEVRGKPSLWVFDEPTTGLHLEDVGVLVRALRRLAERGHAVLVVEHHLDVMLAADRLVDLGPEGGDAGGRIVADGTPEEVARGDGVTARFLRPAAPVRPPRRRRRAPPPAAIEIHGAREHNLVDVTVDLPRDRFVVVSGPSGSGKSTLAFDIVFAEGQRRYIETLSAYARQFVGQLARPDVDHVGGIPPTVAIEQRRTRGGRRSTVATITEVAHFLRLLFARAGVPHCPRCDEALESLPLETLHDRALAEEGEVRLLAPVVLGRKGFHREVFERLAQADLAEARVDGVLVGTRPTPALARYKEHDVEAVVGVLRPGTTSAASAHALIDRALDLGRGTLVLLRADGTTRRLSTSRTCPRDGATVPELDPRFFSPNSHRGWCPKCRGLGVRPTVDAALLPVDETLSIRRGAVRSLALDDDLHRAFVKAARDELGADVGRRWSKLPAATRRLLLHGGRHAGRTFVGAAARLAAWLDDAPEIAVDWLGPYAQHALCTTCGGTRLRPEARAVRVGGATLPALLALPVARFLPALEALPLTGRDAAVAAPIIREIRDRIGFLDPDGARLHGPGACRDHPLGGETQRIRLAAQLGSNLRGVCYVLDEPTIGLHVRDNARLLDALEELRDRGNSLVVVEHDADTIRRADLVIDMGPGGGRQGGRIVAQGTPQALQRNPDSPTGRVLARTVRPPPSPPRRALAAWLEIEGARRHNLAGIDVRLPLGRLVAVTGVSGSGKSTLVRDVVYGAVRHVLAGDRGRPQHCAAIRGARHLGRALEVDATPIGKTPRSVPATYLSIWDEVRKALARTTEARTRGYGPGRFSFNVKEGRCPACDGRGRIKIEMSFLPDVEVPCETCGGRRFTDETLEVTWRGHSAADLLEMTFEEAADLFRDFPRIAPFAELMRDVGLGYLQLGQPSTTLSGGEAQRLKLVTELGRPSRGEPALYVLDEPTTGLHGEDVDRLLTVLRRFVERGDTVLVIEHDLDFIARCDHVIDLGPEGGDEGGRVVAQGTPRQVARAARRSHTGRALADGFAPGRGGRAGSRRRA